MVPDDDRLSPGGKLPPTSDQSYLSLPPVAENVNV